MAAFNRYGVRSISLPVRSHPNTLRIEEELDRLRHWEKHQSSVSVSPSSVNAEAISAGLTGLGALYRCVEDVLDLPLIQHQHDKWVTDLFDDSLTYLDICGSTRDSILLLKQSIRQLQSALRRQRSEDSNLGSAVTSFVRSCKNMKKQTARNLAALKRTNCKFGADTMTARVLGQASSSIIISIFQLLLLFLSARPVVSRQKQRPFTKWWLVSKLVVHGRGAIGCEEMGRNNELECAGAALGDLLDLRISGENKGKGDGSENLVQSALQRVEALFVGIEGIEDGVECLFKGLIQTRVSLLNLLSR